METKGRVGFPCTALKLAFYMSESPTGNVLFDLVKRIRSVKSNGPDSISLGFLPNLTSI